MNIINKLNIFIFLTLIGCDKNNSSTNVNIQNDFDIEYVLINQGDTAISNWRIDGLTYYPIEDKSWIQYQIFDKPNISDTVILKAAGKGYIGCVTQMGVVVAKNWYGINNQGRCFVLLKDTIKSLSQRKIYFHWPVDTLKAFETPWPPH